VLFFSFYFEGILKIVCSFIVVINGERAALHASPNFSKKLDLSRKVNLDMLEKEYGKPSKKREKDK
jgi:hypothetical protein